MSHTMEEDFQHFLSYSGLRKESTVVIGKLRQAYEAAWEPSRPTKYAPDRLQRAFFWGCNVGVLFTLIIVALSIGGR